jgi:signal transduction histidine kinase/ActR/RegA family two-component response regulator/uncharacterized protein YigA (DUF484 family)
MTAVIAICQNAALLAICVLAYSYARGPIERWSPVPRALATGTVFAALTLLSMVAPLRPPPLLLDARTIVIALAAVFGGPLVAVMAAVPAAIYRVLIGGPLVATALAALVTPVALGWGLRVWAARRRVAVTVGQLALVGLLQSAATLVFVLALGTSDARLTFARELMLPLAIANVLGITGFGFLILHDDRRRALSAEMRRRDDALLRNQSVLFHLLRDELRPERSLADQLRAITRIVSEALDVERVSVWLYDDVQPRAWCAARWDGQLGRHVDSPDVRFDVLPDLRAVLAQSMTYRVADMRTDSVARHYHARYPADTGPASVLYTAIRRGEKLIGHVALATVGRRRDWRLEEDSFIHSLADLVGIALLRDELENKERQLRRNQELVVRIVREQLLRAAPLSDVLRAVTEIIGRELAIDRVTIWQLDESSGAMHCLARWSQTTEQHVPMESLAGSVITGLLEQLRRDIVIDIVDYASDPRVSPALREALGTDLPQSGLAALIGSPDQPLGMLTFSSIERPRGWVLEEQTLARSLSHMIAFTMMSHSYREAIAALDLVGEGILVQGPSADVIYANRAARDLGLIAGDLPNGRLSDRDDVDEVAWIAPDGSRHELAISRKRLPDGGVVTMLNDITETKQRQRRHEQLEEQLRQTTKMEAVGRLAGGIAHDFNNMIGATLGFANFLIEDLPEGSEQQGFAKRIAQVCERSRDVVKQLLAFSRPDDAARTVVDLRTAVIDNGTLLKSALPPSTGFVMELGADPLPVLANVGQIYQVLVNLCGNANDALEAKPGSIVVSLARVGREHPDRRVFEGAGYEPDLAIAIGGQLDPERAYAAIRVIDSGAGMVQETIDRIFEPFFSTKGHSRGTGLGLAVVHGIVHAYAGTYLVKSRLGAGSEFAIYLPLVETAPETATAGAGPPIGNESVLVIDDEIDLTDMLSIALGRLGYDVTCCNDPLEAVAAFEQDPDAWDGVITDQAMPTMTGTAVIQRLKELRPGCPVVLCTGFADGTTEQDALAAGADTVLLKPIEAHRIARTMRDLFDRRDPAVPPPAPLVAG